MKTVRSSKPVGLAYPLDRVKEFLQVDSDYEDGTIAALISAAVGVIQQETWIDLHSTVYTAYLDTYETVTIHRYPVTEITSVKYYDTADTLQTMTVNVDYEQTLTGEYAKIRFINTPALRDRDYDNIEIAFKSGYLTRYDIDDELVTALLMIVRDWYDHRETVSIKGTIQDIPFAAKTILQNASKRLI